MPEQGTPQAPGGPERADRHLDPAEPLTVDGALDGDELEESLGEELAGDVGTDPSASLGSESAAGGSTARSSVLRSSVVMGVGTVLSRFGGVLRGMVLAAALGAGVVADAFNLGNTLPNVVYILIIGGALNAVFIPQLVRHMKDDADGGDGYAHSLITLVSTLLLVVTVIAVIAAPWIVGIYATPKYTPEQLSLATAFARFCLPQIFFYGVYTMLSQVLNARGHFGAPMFAPVVNNIVAIATFVLFMYVAGGKAAAADGQLDPDQVALLGIGTTLGVVAQALVLIPVLRRASYHWRPSLRWRGVGLGQAGSLAFWTIGLVLVNQAAYAVIVRLATGVNATSQDVGATPAGLTVYTNAHLMFVLPHSVITVSLVAALLPRMSRAAHDRAFGDLAADISSGMRQASALIVPAAVGLITLGTAAGILLFQWGNTSVQSAGATGRVAEVFALGMLPFTLYYVILRGWYAVERTRTAFFMAIVLNALNLAIAVPLYAAVADRVDGPWALGALALGYVAAYWITLLVAWRVLSRQIGGLPTRRTVGPIARMLAAGLLMFVVMELAQLPLSGMAESGSKVLALLDVVVVGLLGLAVFLGAARALRIGEVTEMLAMVRRRLPVGR